MIIVEGENLSETNNLNSALIYTIRNNSQTFHLTQN